jgi:3-deoxy-7-phosphoheptulonate synthase
VVVVDCSHGNSGKDPARQPDVARDVADQIRSGQRCIAGIMLESHLTGGSQQVRPGVPLVYGQSITDACLSFEETVPVLKMLAEAVEQRRRGS